MMDQRIRIETELIGLALEGKFANLTDILAPKHFTKGLAANNQLIWQACKDLYPNSSINLITVSTHLRRKYDKHYGSYLCNCLASVVSNNPAEMALMLLEFNFREAMIEMLETELKINPEKEKVILDILQEAKNPENDIIELMDDITAFSLKENLELYERFYKMKIRVHKIADSIKELAQVRSLITHLRQLKGLHLDSDRVLAIQELTELLVLTLGSREIPKNFNETLKRIRHEYFK
jgi:hypothetical protein